MRKIIISAATVAAFVAAGTIAYCTSEKNQEKDLIQANYKALLDGEDDGLFAHKCVTVPQQSSDPNVSLYDCVDCEKHYGVTGETTKRCIVH